jgi:PAS domain S-box-containing protein
VDDQTLAILHESLLAEAWHNAEVAAMVFDEDRTFLTANAAYLDLLGYSRQEMSSVKAGANLLADEAGQAAVIALLISEGRLHGTMPIRRADDQVLNVDYFVIPTRVARLPYYIALIWPADGTNRKLRSIANPDR